MAVPDATTPSPRILEEIAFQKEAVARLRREIGDVDRNARRTYIREFHEEYASYQERSSWDDLVAACYQADVVFIGDYHALTGAQELAARLLTSVAERSAGVALGLEMVYGRHQRVLDRYMRGEIAETDFLKAIRYDLDWGYDWQGYRQVLEAARTHGVPAYGIDSAPRVGFRTIHRRDRYAAERLADLAEDHPDAHLVVLFGESHLASRHLPRQVRQCMKRRGLERRHVIVLQNLEAVAWRMAEDGLTQVEVARLAPDVFCHFNTSPISKYEAYRRTIEIWKGESDQDGALDLTSTVHGVVDMILKFLRIDTSRCRVKTGRDRKDLLADLYPEVYSGLEGDDLREILKGASLPAADVEEVLDHLGRNGSCYVPRINAVILGQFNMVHAGEEAAHFINQALKGEILASTPRHLRQHDAFYTAVLEEALGFLGSKIVDPSRNHFFETDFYLRHKEDRATIEATTPYTYEEFHAIIDFVLLHKKFEREYEQYDDVPETILEGIRSEPRRANILVHELGYFLGQQIYDAYHAGVLDRRDIVRLFRASYRKTGSALSAYLDLTRLVAVVPGAAPGSAAPGGPG